MSANAEQRKLAAIMFTDMVGYSALSQRDDKLALELLEEHRQLLRQIFPRFNGTEIKTIGDAFLVEFQSALEAAQCAIEIQRALAKRNADAPAERQIQVRIGIHIGDVVHRGGDVYGDGVNIASRIEPLAGAGGICVSTDVERQIRNALETRFEKLATTELKNISVPMELFRIVLPWEKKSEVRDQKSEVRRTGVSSARSTWVWAGVVVIALAIGGLLAFELVGRDRWARRSDKNGPTPRQSEAATIPDKSIAVLPFDNLSSDKENAYFAEGIQDEILTRLSKIAALKVISRTSTQKYKSAPDNLRDVGKQLGVANLLEGSVQKIANAVHVNVQLIRAATDEHLWAESYNRKLDDVFGVEGEVATAIADQLNAKLTGAEQKAIAEKPTQNAAAYDAYLRGVSLETVGIYTQQAQQVAAFFAQAVQLDPNFALAWARLALTQSYLYFNGIEPSKNSGAAVREAADRAIVLQPDLGEAWLAQGVYRYRVLRDFNGALQSYQEALKRVPNSALIFEQMGHVERRLGQAEAAQKHYQMAAQLDPRNLKLLFSVADVLESARRFDETDAIYDRILQVSPGNEAAYVAKAFNFQSQGKLSEAAKELSKIDPHSRDDNVVLARYLQFFYERKFNEAIALLTTPPPPPIAEDPRTMTGLGFCQLFAGRTNDARATFQRTIATMKPSPDATVPVDARMLPSFLAWCYAGLGEKEKALELARQAVADYQNDVLARPFTEQVLAQVQAQFGDLDSAFAALPHLLEMPNGVTVGDLRIDPFWDPLRKDPRFEKLCQEQQH